MVCSVSTYNFRRKLTLYELLMVYAIKNSTYRGDICNLEDRSAADPQPKKLDEKANLTAKRTKHALSKAEGSTKQEKSDRKEREGRKDVGAGFKAALLPSW